MKDLILRTFDWVPDAPRGCVRDVRIRWALKEAGLPYRVASTPFRNRGAEHFAHQPFGQVPWLTDGDLSIFETGAILLHLGERSAVLLPTERRARSDAIQWLVAALNSVEPATVRWAVLQSSGNTSDSPRRRQVETLLQSRLSRVDAVLATRDWLAGSFSIADIVMSDVLRLVHRFDGLATYPACHDYVARATARAAFAKAHADQMAHFAAAD